MREFELINFKTGECFETTEQYKESIKRLPKHRPTGYVGIDTEWLSNCKDETALLVTLKQIDPYLMPKSRVMVDNAYLLDCVASGLLSGKNVGSLLRLSNYCSGWNIGFAPKDVLLVVSGCSKKNFARWLDEIKPYVSVERLHSTRLSDYSDEYRLVFNPLVVWKGCMVIREAKMREYYLNNKGSLAD